MTTLTIPAREILIGDVLTIAGLPFTAAGSSSLGRTQLTFLNDAGRQSDLYLDPNQTVTVDRPDPDEALVEVMAQAIRSYNYASNCPASGSWDETTDSIRAAYRSNARAALAAAREAGLL